MGRRVLHLFFNFFPFFFHPHRRRRSYTHTTKKETRRRGKKRKKRNETKLRSSCPEERPEGVVVEREKKEIAKKKKKNRFLLLWFSPIFVRFPRFPTPRNTKKKRPGERCGLAAFYWVFVPSFRTAGMGLGGGGVLYGQIFASFFFNFSHFRGFWPSQSCRNESLRRPMGSPLFLTGLTGFFFYHKK